MTCEAGVHRFNQADICELSRPEVWAELTFLEARLARLVFSRSAPRVIWSRADRSIVSDQDWLIERIERLQDRYRTWSPA